MKKMILNSRNIITAVLLMILTKVSAFAQTSLGDPTEPTDSNAPPTHVFLLMAGLAIVLILVFYAGYRYWRSKTSINKQAPGTHQ